MKYDTEHLDDNKFLMKGKLKSEFINIIGKVTDNTGGMMWNVIYEDLTDVTIAIRKKNEELSTARIISDIMNEYISTTPMLLHCVFGYYHIDCRTFCVKITQ